MSKDSEHWQCYKDNKRKEEGSVSKLTQKEIILENSR